MEMSRSQFDILELKRKFKARNSLGIVRIFTFLTDFHKLYFIRHAYSIS